MNRTRRDSFVVVVLGTVVAAACASGEPSRTIDVGTGGVAPSTGGVTGNGGNTSGGEAGSPSTSNGGTTPSDAALPPPQDGSSPIDGGSSPSDALPGRVVAWLTDPASHVNTTIGTTTGGNTFPGAVAPFGMVQWSPDTSPDRPSGGGYDYKDKDLIGFSLTHLSGPGCSGALGDVPILPLTGGLPGGDLNAAKQAFSHTGEIATAGSYSVQLGTPAIKTELTATLHSAMARFTYPSTANANLLVKLQDSANGNYGAATAAIVGDREITGSTSSGGFCGTGQPYTLSFDIVFDHPFTASQVISQAGKTSPGFVFLTFDATKTAVVQAKVGISFVSVANARGNWSAENAPWDFDAVKTSAIAAWNAMLGQVQVAGGTTAQQELFTTSLYHSLLHPNVATDTNGQYMGFDNKVHAVTGPQKEQYVNYSGWDIYHSQVQLSALVAPQAMSDSAQSMLNDAAQNKGRLPKWSLEHGENGIMVGDPSDGILAGYHAFGATQFDTATALKVMLAEATVPSDIRPGLADYQSRGYVPDDVGFDQAGGMTLEYIQADFALSQFAAALGDQATAATMLARAQNWQQMFDASVSMFIPKRKDGTFAPGVGPSSSHGLTEGDASQYRWVIAFNRAAQLSAMGGVAAANPALDAFFAKLDDYQGPCALLTNEFELGAPYWSNHTGAAWKTQEVVNRVRTTLYHDAPKFIDGVDTNDDLGALSSALVWAMVGLYPSYSGSAILSVNGPLFTDVRLHLPSGKTLDLHADGAATASPYIQSLTVDGVATDKPWLPASVVTSGASLAFQMGPTPNKTWGADHADPLFAAGVQSTSAFLFATPNPLVLAPGASAEVTLVAQSARADAAQTLSWSVSASGFAFKNDGGSKNGSGSLALAPGARATTKVSVTAPTTTGNATMTFKATSSLSATPPDFVLPVSVK